MVGPCRFADNQPITVFNTGFGKVDTVLSTTFYKERFVEVREHIYTILLDFADSSDSDVVRGVKLPLGVMNDADLWYKTSGLLSSCLKNA